MKDNHLNLLKKELLMALLNDVIGCVSGWKETEELRKHIAKLVYSL